MFLDALLYMGIRIKSLIKRPHTSLSPTGALNHSAQSLFLSTFILFILLLSFNACPKALFAACQPSPALNANLLIFFQAVPWSLSEFFTNDLFSKYFLKLGDGGIRNAQSNECQNLVTFNL